MKTSGKGRYFFICPRVTANVKQIEGQVGKVHVKPDEFRQRKIKTTL